MHASHLPRFVRHGAFFAVAFASLTPLHAQAQFAGTYFGTINTKVSAGGFNVESSLAGYITSVTAAGVIDVNSGAITGTVNASGAVTFTGGSGFATFGLHSATIASNQLSSAKCSGKSQQDQRAVPYANQSRIRGVHHRADVSS